METLSFVVIAAAAAGHLMAMVSLSVADCIPPSGCVALAYYTFNATSDGNLTSVAIRFQANLTDMLWYSQLKNTSVEDGQVLHIPFPCACASGGYLGHNFSYTVLQGDEGRFIASQKYEFLTSVATMTWANPMTDLNVIFPNNILTIPVNCSCGDPHINSSYGLFLTYVARENDNANVLETKFKISKDLLQSYNKHVNLDVLVQNSDILYIPAKDGNGNYPVFNSIDNNKNVVIGASVGSVAFLLLVITGVIGMFMYTKKKKATAKFRKQKGPGTSLIGRESSGTYSAESGYSYNTESMSTSVPGFAYNRSVEFTYEELSAATNDFSIAKKIGEGGYGSVYYGEIRGQKLAIKRMNMQATREFLAELKVLTRVHHTNLVSLVGYCTVEYLFLVYEYVENGTLSQHLKHSRKEGREPLSWPKRIQIALDAARGLEYIHEHTTPTYIHRDVKSSNILLDNNFRAKVADFGLTKLTDAGIGAPSRLVGTFGYMAPEYARLGDVSSKSDVYSFGVVLFEIISAKDAIIHGMNLSEDLHHQRLNTQGLVNLFEEALVDAVNGKEKLCSLVDPALKEDYPMESVWKMANLAAACTREEPSARPNMRVVVVALMSLSSLSQDWGTDPGSDAFITGR